MGFLTLLSGVVIGAAGTWLYNHNWKLPTRRTRSNVMVVDTPTPQAADITTPLGEKSTPTATQTV